MKGINHISLSVSDLERSLDFYSEAVGLDVVARHGINGVTGVRRPGDGPHPTRATILGAPNGFLELLEFPGARTASSVPVPVEGPGVTHVCFQAPSVDGLFQRCLSHGAVSVTRGDEPVDLGGYGVHYGYARDEDQIMFEIEQVDEPQFATPRWLAHVALVSPDLDVLVEFYRAVLGADPYRREEGLRGRRLARVADIDDVQIRAAWFRTGSMVLELWQYVHPVTSAPTGPRPIEVPGYNKFSFEVDDIASECARLRSVGLNVFGEPVSADGVTEVFARDPDGNLFSLITLPADSPYSLDRCTALTW